MDLPSTIPVRYDSGLQPGADVPFPHLGPQILSAVIQTCWQGARDGTNGGHRRRRYSEALDVVPTPTEGTSDEREPSPAEVASGGRRSIRCNPTGYLSVSTFCSHSAPAPAPRLGSPLRARGPVPLLTCISKDETGRSVW